MTCQITCPKCGAKPKKTVTKYGDRYSCCDLWAWGHHPLVDAETHRARNAAHAAFDPLWQSRTYGRGTAYKLLAEHLGLSRDDCHMKLMDKETAAKVPAIAKILREKAE